MADVDLLVVGGGPAGLAAAIAARGLHVPGDWIQAVDADGGPVTFRLETG